MNEIPEAIIKITQEFLGKEMIDQFKEWYEKYHSVSPIIKEDNILYPVNLREGSMVRSFMRDSGFCGGWVEEDFNKNWEILVMAACGIIKEEKEVKKEKEGRFVYSKNKNGEWEFKILSTDGKVLALSIPVASKNECMNNISDIKRLAMDAQVSEQ